MSVLCVITTMMRPWLSAMPRKSACGLSVPRSGGAAAARAPEVDARHLRHVRDLEQRFANRMIGAECRRSGTRAAPRRIASAHCSHARVPQKSSTQRKPPLSRYSRSRVISSGASPIVPTSDPTRNGHSNSASSVSWTVQ